MAKYQIALPLSACALLLTACASNPMGPTVQVMPSPNKPFPVFQQDQEQCKQYAQSQTAGQAEAANRAATGQAALGILLGAGLGAAVGNHHGAGVGAATGAIAGTATGSATSQNAQLAVQEQYNNAYVQCMYARGNQVPGMAPLAQADPPPPPPVAAATPPATPAPAAAPAPGSGTAPPAMTVAQAQVRLNTLGYANGHADGAMGPKTHAALKLFQTDRNLPATGELDADTVAELSR